MQNEFSFGEVDISKELQKHVLEIKPGQPQERLDHLEKILYTGLLRLQSSLENRYKFLGLGMHPILELKQTAVWEHEEKEVYDEYNRLFNIKQHGWLNIQALQINIPYFSSSNLVKMYNRLRSLIPYLVAVSAASPFVEGKLTTNADNRLLFYRQNQKKIPLISYKVIPDKIKSMDDAKKLYEKIYRELRKKNADILCKEWVDSRGVIIRFSRRCLEIKAIDEQECLHSDMAIVAFIRSLLRCKNLDLEEDRDSLLDLTDSAIKYGTKRLQQELRDLYTQSLKTAKKDEKRYLALIYERINSGSLSEIIAEEYRSTKKMIPLLNKLNGNLCKNIPYSRDA